MVTSQHPEIAQKLAAEYEAWWNSLGPALVVNETAAGPALNPFKELYWRQFGGQPSPEELRLMDINQNPATRPEDKTQDSPATPAR